MLTNLIEKELQDKKTQYEFKNHGWERIKEAEKKELEDYIEQICTEIFKLGYADVLAQENSRYQLKVKSNTISLYVQRGYPEERYKLYYQCDGINYCCGTLDQLDKFNKSFSAFLANLILKP